MNSLGLIPFNFRILSKFITPLHKAVTSLFYSSYKISNENVILTKVISTDKNFNSKHKCQTSSFSPNSFDINSVIDDSVNGQKITTESAEIISSFKNDCERQEHFIISQLKSEISKLDSAKPTPDDWEEIRNEVLNIDGAINQRNIDAVIINKCIQLQSLALGKSYFNFLRSTKKVINRATYGNYLLLFYACRCECTSEDLHEIESVYKELLQVYPILDAYTAEKVICALSLTKIWREYEKLFATIKQFYNPSSNSYAAVIKSAFNNQEYDLGWKLIEELELQGTQVPDGVFISWLNLKQGKDDNYILKLLEFLSNFSLQPSLELCEAIRKSFEENCNKRKGNFTTISRNGECRNCHALLEKAHVSQKDFSELREAFLNPVLIGKDIFLKTKPEEFKHFLDFLEKAAPFDVILDGLNIALMKTYKNKSVTSYTFQLKSVVKHFVAQKKSILVLGRKHMSKWKTREMEYVCNHARLFLTDDLSHDDPFMLYAALYSGLGTCIVSRDLMRGHKFLLTNPKLKATFLRWQSQHQYFNSLVEPNGTVHLKPPVPFMQTIQQNSGGDWHIPCKVKEELTTWDKVDHLHKHWLCLQNSSLKPRDTYNSKFQDFNDSSSKRVRRSIDLQKVLQDSQ